MCEFCGKLVAWLDRELGEDDAAAMERHLAACAECRERLAAYEQASTAFDACCEAAFAAEARRARKPRWVVAACGAGAIAAAAALAAVLILPRSRVAETPRPAVARISTVPAAPQALQARGSAAPQAAPRTEVPRTARPAGAALQAARPPALVAPTRKPHNAGNIAASTARTSPARTSNAIPGEPPIEIAIPADAMFPPGAVPPGMSFTADLTISPEGSPERLRLHPRLAGFERRANQP